MWEWAAPPPQRAAFVCRAQNPDTRLLSRACVCLNGVCVGSDWACEPPGCSPSSSPLNASTMPCALMDRGPPQLAASECAHVPPVPLDAPRAAASAPHAATSRRHSSLQAGRSTSPSTATAGSWRVTGWAPVSCPGDGAPLNPQPPRLCPSPVRAPTRSTAPCSSPTGPPGTPVRTRAMSSRCTQA